MPEIHDPDLNLVYFIDAEQAIANTATTLSWSRRNDIKTYDVIDLSEWQDWIVFLENVGGGSGAAFSNVEVFAGPTNEVAKVTLDMAPEKSTIEANCQTLAAGAMGAAYSSWNGSIPYHLIKVTADTSDTTLLGWIYGRR